MNTISNIYKTPAFEELTGIFSGWRIWFTLAWNDIKLRYRRSSLGPLWITASMAVRIYFMGFLYSHLFKVSTVEYFPFLAASVIAWTSISTTFVEAANTFIYQENYLRNIKILYSHLIMNVVLRNLIIFAHNFLALIPIIFYYRNVIPDFHLINCFLLIPNGLLIIFNMYIWNTIIAIFGTRFRDIHSIIESVMQIVFFVTPIMWMPSLLPEKYHLAITLNPFYHVLSLVRNPLMGQAPEFSNYLMLLSITTIGLTVFYYLVNKTKHRIIFWL